MADRKPLTTDQVWADAGIMAANAEWGGPMEAVMRLVRAVEHAHGIRRDGAGTVLAPEDLKWLERIQDQFADGEGYDAPADVMKRLADLGVIRRTSGSRYTVTSFGMHVLFPDEWPFPLKTHGEYMAEANARLAAKCG